MTYEIPSTQEFKTLAINILPGFRLFSTAGGDCIQIPTAWETSAKATFQLSRVFALYTTSGSQESIPPYSLLLISQIIDTIIFA